MVPIAHDENVYAGTMMLDFRPVDCYTKEPLEFLPPFVNETIYAGGMQAGWSW